MGERIHVEGEDSLQRFYNEQVQKVFADKVAEEALKLITDDQLKLYATDLFQSLKWNTNKTRYWKSDATDMQSIVYTKFKEKVGVKLQEIVDNGLFDEEAKDTAERIYKESLESAEKYIVEALALRMCSVNTDFNNQLQRLDMRAIVDEVMFNNHVPR